MLRLANIPRPSGHPLAEGTVVGRYLIKDRLGVGGMGEVYRARDAQLGRDVAIKILPAALLADPDRRDRFEREARVLASLNHPNIAAIYGIEESDGIRGLALELVPGPTLAERVALRPFAIREALQVACQIALALEPAHAKGIVHRDIKPANVKLGADGEAKVLDFGIATISRDDRLAAADGATLTADGTGQGLIIGTAAYMSPEQARGIAVDKRTDIWSFGCVLFEMLTGRAPFRGQTTTDTIARILEREPAWETLPKATPPTVVRLLHRCLEKELKRRLQDIGDARIELEDALSATSKDGTAATSRKRLVWIASGLVALLVVGAVGTVVILRLRHQEMPVEPVTFRIIAPQDAEFLGPPQFGLSPDGRQIVFTAVSKAVRTLWLQPFGSLSAQSIPGTEEATFPFWSPDGRFVAFFAGGKLKKVQVTGGPPIDVCDVSIGRGGTWNADGEIVFSTVEGSLQRVPSAGGVPRALIELDTSRGDVVHQQPQFLPDGRHILFTVAGRTGEVRIASLDGSQIENLIAVDSPGRYSAGHLVFARGTTLLAQPFDPRVRKLSGEPFPVAEQVSGGLAAFAVSADDNLAFVGREARLSRLTWLDRTGAHVATVGEAAQYLQFVLSPDGKRLAAAIRESNSLSSHLWTVDVASGRSSRLTFGVGLDLLPLWSPDGKTLVFTSNREGPLNRLLQRPSNASGSEDVLLVPDAPNWVNDWSRDGRFIVYSIDSKVTDSDLKVLSIGDRQSQVFAQTNSYEGGGAFSPDGRWISYESDASGRYEVYVRPFPDKAEQHLISRTGGRNAMWRADGLELFFLGSDGMMMVAAIDTTNGFSVRGLSKLFAFPDAMAIAGQWHRYDVREDGARFLALVPETRQTPPAITVILNWPALLVAK